MYRGAISLEETGKGNPGGAFSVLVVEDQAGVRRLLEEAIREEGEVLVYTAENGEQALRQVEQHLPSLVFLDMKMPGLSGLEVLKEFKNMSYKFPVVLITAYGEMDMIRQAESLGVTHSLAKPFDIEEVKALVRSLRAVKNSPTLGCGARG